MQTTLQNAIYIIIIVDLASHNPVINYQEINISILKLIFKNVAVFNFYRIFFKNQNRCQHVS